MSPILNRLPAGAPASTGGRFAATRSGAQPSRLVVEPPSWEIVDDEPDALYDDEYLDELRELRDAEHAADVEAGLAGPAEVPADLIPFGTGDAPF